MKKIVWFLALLCGPLIALFLWRTSPTAEDAVLNDLIAEREKLSYEYVSQSDDPLIRALHTGEIKYQTPIETATTLATPIWTENYGPYAKYGFEDRGYSWRTLVTYKGRIIQATAGSCTWDWTFFDHLAEEDAVKIYSVGYLKKYLIDHPEDEEIFSRIIQEQLSSLK